MTNRAPMICPRCFALVSQELRKYVLPHEARDVIEILRRQMRPPRDGAQGAAAAAFILALFVLGVFLVNLFTRP